MDMQFSKLLLKSRFDNVLSNYTKKERCNTSNCILYNTPPCKDMPLYPPQQFPTYYDTIDPNSVIKYRDKPTCRENFTDNNYCKFDNFNIIFAGIVVIITFYAFVYIYKDSK